MFVGVGASRVRDMFEQAKKNAPCIVFIDEIDAVGRHRGAGLGNGNDEREQTLNQLLVEMDGFEANEGHHHHRRDQPSRRARSRAAASGRFDRQVVVPRPDIEGREKILAVHMKKVPLAPDVVGPHDRARHARFLGRRSRQSGERGGAARRAQGQAAGRHVRVREGQGQGHDGAPSAARMVMTEDEKRMTAYHEAGHAIVALHEPASDPIHKATIIPRGRALGMVMRLPERDSYSYHRDKMYANLAVAMGRARCRGSDLWLRQVSSGASSDIQYATGLARDMVTKWACRTRWAGRICTAGRRELPWLLVLAASAHVQPDRAADRRRDQDDRGGGLNRAKELLTKHSDQLHTLAQALLEYETLSGDEIKKLLAGETIDRGGSA
jgi:cell division protease FtsH